MPTLRSFLCLLFHLGCFAFSSHHRRRRRHGGATQSPFKKKLTTPKTSRFSFFKNLFSSFKQNPNPPPIHSIPSPSSSTRSMRLNPPPLPEETNPAAVFPGEINPCPLCGEIFQTSSLLDHHQSIKHAVSDLLDGENILRIIFKTGWPDRARTPTIRRILKIHNGPKTIARFEDYRESIKSKASEKIQTTLKDQRCIADGNELLRFYCTTFICGLDSAVCGHQYCSACAVIRGGFSPKMDGIATFPTSWTAHTAVPEDLEEEFSFMKIKRALLVCRVIAGRVGSDPCKEDPCYDSLEGPAGRNGELLVFNTRALLPCFMIVYTV